MIVHPIVFAVAAADLLTLLVVAWASWTAVAVVSRFRRGAADRGQIALERRAGAASIQGRIAVGLLLFSSLLTLVAVASILPDVVPGAMCGTGVLQAMGAAGERALAFRALAVVALAAWALVDGLDRAHPEGPLTEAAARAMLVALPLVVLAVVETTRAMVGLEAGEAVHCCAAVYDAARVEAVGGEARWGGSAKWVVSLSVGGGILALLGAALRLSPRARSSLPAPCLLAVGTVALSLATAVGLRSQLAAYWYGVLDHECLFCLFAGRHVWVGYAMLAALVVTVVEGLAAGLAALVASRVPAVSEMARARIGKAGLRSALAAIVLVALAVGPALAWRLGRGAWIEG